MLQILYHRNVCYYLQFDLLSRLEADPVNHYKYLSNLASIGFGIVIVFVNYLLNTLLLSFLIQEYGLKYMIISLSFNQWGPCHKGHTLHTHTYHIHIHKMIHTPHSTQHILCIICTIYGTIF